MLALLVLVVGMAGSQALEGLPEKTLAEIQDRRHLPTGRATLEKRWQAEGPEARHIIGRAVSDGAAEGGKAWQARLFTDPPASHMLYGPYLEVPAGDYLALVRMKLENEAGEEPVALLDAAASTGQSILRTKSVLGSDLRLKAYVRVPLAFRHPGGKLECRVYWLGYSTLTVDMVELYRLEGARMDLSAERVPQPEPSGKPDNLAPVREKRPFAEILPRSAPPGDPVFVVNTSRQPPDWQLLYTALQGLVNRKQPVVYNLFNPTDASWLNWMRRNGWVRRTVSLSSPREMLTRYRAVYRGVVVTDPANPATKNVACMLASVEGALVASPRIAAELKLPVVADLRGRWKTSVQAYRWAFDNLWPRLNHHVIACSWPDHIGLRDYLVQHRVFTFWLSGPIDGARPYADAPGELRLMEELLARMPTNIPVLSYPWAARDVGIGEGPGVTLFAEFAKYLVGSINCSNLSVHSGIRLPRLATHTPPAPRLQPRKVYLAIVMSDGDNLPVLTVNNFPQLWKEPLRGSLPISWTLSPAAMAVMPGIVKYYYDTATPNDSFLGAVSGVGYTYPDSYAKRYREQDRLSLFDEFLAQTAAYMQRAGLNSLWIMNATRPEVIARYAERIPALRSLYPDYGRRAGSYADATYPTARNVPVFHALTTWPEEISREERVRRLAAEIRSYTPPERPAFMHFFVLNWFADLALLKEVVDALGPDYVPVRHDHLAELYKQYLSTQQLLMRSPQSLVNLPGGNVELELSLRNVAERRLSVSVAVSAGLSGEEISPRNVELAPAEEARVVVRGTATAGTLHLRALGPFGERQRAVAVRVVPSEEVLGELPDVGTLRFVRQYEAEQMPRNAGREQTDAEASEGKGVAIEKGDPYRGYVVFGPYAPTSPGRYVALFRVKRRGEGTGEGIFVDACLGGGRGILAEKSVACDALPTDRFRSIVVAFDHPGGDLELRYRWPGNAGMLLDSVTLWRVGDR